MFYLTSSKDSNKYEIYKYHQIRKFKNIDLRKVDFLSAEKISVKLMLLPKFAFDVIYTRN